MILIEKRWDKTFLDIKYGDGYDIRVHAVQVALCLLARRSQITGPKLNSVNLALVKFGFYDVETEHSIKLYQEAVGIAKSGILNRVTYESMFETVKSELKSMIVQIAEKKLQIKEITSEIVDEDYDLDIDNVISNSPENYYSNNNVYPNYDYLELYYNDQADEERTSISISSTNNTFFDRFWSSMVDNYDSVFLSATIGTISFGSGGTLNLSGTSTDVLNGRYSSSNNDNDNFGSNYIDSLLSNSIYSGNYDYTKPSSWISNSSMNINVDGYSYEASEKHKTFFSSNNSSTTRKSNYDITVVYGANGQFAKKILGVVHRARTQQVDSSGEAIFDVIEFIAKDIIETDNTRK